MPTYMKHLPTDIYGIKANEYIKDLLSDFIKDVCEGSVSHEEAMREIQMCEHMALSQYVDIPYGIEGDHLIRELVARINYFFKRLENDFEDILENSMERYDNNQSLTITAALGGIWVDY